MKIIYKDGSALECYTIEICGGELYCDDMYIVPVDDVERIED